MNYKTVKEISDIWKVKPTIVTYFCRNGKISGAVKTDKSWLIPENTLMPKDGRCTTRTYRRIFLPLPIGVSDYKEAVSKYYYVDKTLLLKDIIDSQPKVSLFTRPRRFGKTLNMDMIKTFFEKTKEDNSIYFKDKDIWACGEEYQNYQGKYPVIFLTFKDVKCNTWEETYKKIINLIIFEFIRHEELRNSENLNSIELGQYNDFVENKGYNVDYEISLQILSLLLYKHYNTKPIIIIDEYDTPITQGYIKGFYNNIISFMRNLFSGAFKDNKNITFGFLTGILRVAKESIFSGMNNLIENSILNKQYSTYFGFTKEEVKSMLMFYERVDKFDEICEWYDGYKFGLTEILNPWSVLCYIRESCEPQAFWKNTGSNDIIRQIICDSTPEIKEQLHLLLKGESVIADVDSSVIYPEIKNNPQTIFSFLLITGYLKVVEKIPNFSSNTFCKVAIPNKEIKCIYGKEIISAVNDLDIQSTAILIQQDILSKDVYNLQRHLQAYLTKSISIFDTDKEGFYHGLMLGLYAIMNNLYAIKSNRESGEGRFDIQMNPFDKSIAGIIIELKVLSKPIKTDEMYIDSELEKLSSNALKQIDEKHYTQELVENGVKKILKFGIAFYKKQVKVILVEEDIINA